MGSLAPHIVEDCMGVIQVYSDGTVHRRHVDDCHFSEIADDSSVSFDDVVFDEKLNLSLRIYRPSIVGNRRLPVVFYLHGGGFCVGSRLWPNCHGSCQCMAAGLEAIVITPDYRLAPEHRLPAAFDDAEKAVKWLAAVVTAARAQKGELSINLADPTQVQVQEDLNLGGGYKNNSNEIGNDNGIEWLGETVDLERVFVLGDSSGGNMAHHLAVRMGLVLARFGAVKVKGFVLLAPFFGGVVRTKSEEGPNETMLNLEILDRFWRLSMPEGETRDHPFANPFGPNSPNLEKVTLKPILAIAGEKELLKDRVKNYAMNLKDIGKDVEYVELEGEEHGFFTKNPYSETSQKMLQLMKQFMLQNSK